MRVFRTTVSGTDSKTVFNCSGGTSYPLGSGFAFMEETDLVVVRVLNGVEAVLSLTTDYTVSGGSGATGTVTTVETYSDGQLVVYRDTSAIQSYDAEVGDGFDTDTFERQLDRMTMAIQDQSRRVASSVRFADSSTVDGDAVLPSPSPGKALIWNTDGTGFINGGSSIGTGNLAVLESHTEMKAVTSPGGTVVVRGRLVVNDGGEGVFIWNGSDLSAEVSSDPLGGVYVPPNSNPTGTYGAWVRQHSGTLNPRWFGAKGDGTTDDRAPIQAAMDLGGTLFFPLGTYLLISTHPDATDAHLYLNSQNYVRFVGIGEGSILKANTTDKDLIRITSSYGGGFDKISLDRIAGAVAGGNGIHFYNAYASPRWESRDLRVRNQYVGMYASTSRIQGSKWVDCVFENNVSHGVWLAMNNDEFFTSSEFNSNGGSGIKMGSGTVADPSNGSLYLTNCLAYGNGSHGIYITGNATYKSLNVFITGGISDTNTVDGLRLEYCHNVVVSGFRASFNGERGVVLYTGAREVTLGGEFSDNELEGIWIGGGVKHVTGSALRAMGNGRSGLGNYGVKLQNGCDGINIVGLMTGTPDDYVSNNGVTGDITLDRSNQAGGVLVDATASSPLNVDIMNHQYLGIGTAYSTAGVVDGSVSVTS